MFRPSRSRSIAAWFVVALGLAVALAPGDAAARTMVTLCETDVQQTAPGGQGVNLETALQTGGRITFDCGAATIRITKFHVLTRAVDLDGEGRITLDAGRTASMFGINAQSRIALRRLTVRGAVRTGISLGRYALVGTVVRGRGLVELQNVRTERCDFPYDVDVLIANDQSVFTDNGGNWVIRARNVELRDVEFATNTGMPLASSGAFPPGNAGLQRVQIVGNGAPIAWIGDIGIRQSRFASNGNDTSLGGALRVAGQTTISKTEFVNNRALRGGAIWVERGVLDARRLTFEGNRAVELGGAIAAKSGGTQPIELRLRYTKLRDNAARYGGAIALQAEPGPATNHLFGNPIHFARNTAAISGGGLYAPHGRAELSRATFVGNRAGTSGGAIFGGRTTFDTMQIGNGLLMRNVAPTGGGFHGAMLDLRSTTVGANEGGGLVAAPLLPVSPPGSVGQIRFANTIVTANVGGNCVAAPSVEFVDDGNNLQHPGTDCGASLRSVDPFLDSFFVPYVGSPARFAGNNTICTNDPLVRAKDIFGDNRPEGGGPCTIGAIERDLLHHAVRLLRDERELPDEVKKFFELIGVRKRQ